MLNQSLLLIAWAGSFIASPYSRILSAKNLIIPEVVMFSKTNVLLIFNIPVNETLAECQDSGTGCIG
jgi:hypothetical protein